MIVISVALVPTYIVENLMVPFAVVVTYYGTVYNITRFMV